MERTDVEPFTSATITSACIKVFRTNFLAPETLAIPAPDDYRRQFKTYSSSGIQWLEWQANSLGLFIQHALNHGEKKVGPYFVDGHAVIDAFGESLRREVICQTVLIKEPEESYAYQTRIHKKVVLRVKGITQTQECCERVNFDSIRGLVDGFLDGKEGLVEAQHQKARYKKGFVLKNRTLQKEFRVVYDKRTLLPDGTTL
ncbi:uncharacterized protein V6R79_008006 [Siganus canaliculatus]